jgi:hypothetical protein
MVEVQHLVTGGSLFYYFVEVALMNVNLLGGLFVRSAFALAVAVVASVPANAALIQLKTVADSEVSERPSEDRGTNDGLLNVRTSSGNDRNEIIALKFDLSSVNLANVTSATANLIHNRVGSTRTYIVYGVNDGAVGADNNTPTTPARGYDDNTWDEALVKFSNMPGLLFDGNPAAASQGIVVADTTNIGNGAFNGGAKGAVQPLTTPGLLSFLQSHPDSIVTLLIAKDTAALSTGQDRFASRNATSLDGGTPSGVAGDFAPYLELNVVPEPTSIALLAMAGVFAAIRMRRAGA